MKLLLDQNLSKNLIVKLHIAFPKSHHVTALGLDTATDREIWDRAAEEGYMIVSKDSDFRHLAILHGPPPKVVWLRVGNATSTRVLQVLLDHVGLIEGFALTEGEALLVLPAI